MANSRRDQNYVTTGSGVSSVDGTTPVDIRVDPVTSYLLIEVVDISTSGAITPVDLAKHDQNHVPVHMGVNVSDSTPLVLRTHNGYLAIQFN